MLEATLNSLPLSQISFEAVRVAGDFPDLEIFGQTSSLWSKLRKEGISVVEGADQACNMTLISSLIEIVIASINYSFLEAASSCSGMVGVCL